MKKTLLTLITGLAIYSGANAQIVNAYSFSQSAGTFTPITGGTVLGDELVDEELYLDPSAPLGDTPYWGTTGPGFPIGFDFTYNGIVFDRIGISTNGWISFGQSALTPSVDMESNSYYDLPLSQSSLATPDILRNRIGALAMDMLGQTGSELRIETIGTAPNQVCVIQWQNFGAYDWNIWDATGSYTFQLRLDEATNSIEVVYGTSSNGTNTAPAQVGLSGTTENDFNLRNVSTDWAASTLGTVNTDTCHLTGTVVPASGQTYTWTVPAVCSGTPVAGTASAPDSVCSGVDFALTLTGYSSGVSGLSFQWQWSATENGTYADVTGATTPTYNASQTAVTYYRCVVTCSNGGATAIADSIMVGLKNYTNCYCIPAATDCTDGDIITNITFGALNHTTACSTNGYSYNDTLVPSYNIGSTHLFSVTVGDGSTENVSVWIDYNRNGVFENSEYKFVGSGSDETIADSTITIPNTALAGQTRMRVRTRFLYELVDSMACYDAFTYGETEDYLINLVDTMTTGIVTSAALNNMAVYPNPTAGAFTIAVNNADFAQIAINVMDMQGKVVYSATDKNVGTNYNKQINLDGIAKGIYYVKMTTEKGFKVHKLVIQ